MPLVVVDGVGRDAEQLGELELRRAAPVAIARDRLGVVKLLALLLSLVACAAPARATAPVERTASAHDLTSVYGYAANNPVRLTDRSGNYADDPALSMLPLVGPANDAGLATHRALIAYENGDTAGAAQQGLLAVSNTLFAVVDAVTLGSASALRAPAAAMLQAEAKNVVRTQLESAVELSAPGRLTAPQQMTESGIGVTEHGVQQKINREVRTVDELDAIKNPLKVGPVKVDSLGRESKRLVGRKAEVAMNPHGEIVSVNPTSSKKAARLEAEKAKKP